MERGKKESRGEAPASDGGRHKGKPKSTGRSACATNLSERNAKLFCEVARRRLTLGAWRAFACNYFPFHDDSNSHFAGAGRVRGAASLACLRCGRAYAAAGHFRDS